MKDKVAQFLSQYRLLKQGDEVTVGLSGGADSVALLLILASLRPEWDLTLRACHVNHCLRGAESDADEAFCHALCERLSVPLTIARCNVSAYCEQSGESSEAGARHLRYEALFSAAGSGLIATAHHLDDNTETVLLNLLRGTALDGLCGIPVRRGPIIRPLLCVTRAEIEHYLAELGQPYRTDSTNLADDALRNRLRHAVLPILREQNPNLVHTVGRMTQLLTADRKFLDAAAAEKYETAVREGVLRRECYCVLPDALRLRVLRRFLRKANVSVTAERLSACDALLLAGVGSRPLSKSFVFTVGADGARLSAIQKSEKIVPRELSLSDFPARISLTGDKSLEIRILSRQEKKFFVNCDQRQFKNCIDCAKIQKSLRIRSREPGDVVRLSGRGCTKSLKKLFWEASVPPSLRDAVALLEIDGQIAWVEGFGAAEGFAAAKDSEQVLFIKEDS